MAYVPAPGYQSIFNPPIPHTSMICGGLRPGMAVCILASLPKNHTRFAINFMTGEDEASSNIAMHTSVRYDGIDRCVFNSKRNGEWEAEELKKKMPFKAGKPFLILFEITPNNYIVYANGERFYEFAHRMSMDQVQWINASGDVIVHELEILASGSGVKGFQSMVQTAAQVNLPPMLGPPFLNPTVPFKAYINGGMIPKRTVVIKGMPNGKSFSINLKAGNSNDIGFHMNPRISKGTLVRNSHINGEWGKEETQVAKNPFKEGEYFTVSIRSGGTKYKVFINGSKSFDYDSRSGSIHCIDCIEVAGNVSLVYVFF